MSLIEQELQTRVERLITEYEEALAYGKPSYYVLQAIAEPFAKWFSDTFRVGVPSTPKGGKAVKEKAIMFLWVAKNAVSQGWTIAQVQKSWQDFQPFVPALIALFSDEGSVQQTKEIQTSLATYKNLKGLSSATFEKYVKSLDLTFAALKGWRRKALEGNLTVALAGPEHFRGTAAGKYNAPSDTLFVRATPAILQRSGTSYASPEYIIVHELGHRYERFHGDIQAPYTTPYSYHDEEAFAELFALGHFNIRSHGKHEFGDTVDQFEKSQGKLSVLASRVASRYCG